MNLQVFVSCCYIFEWSILNKGWNAIGLFDDLCLGVSWLVDILSDLI